ncbi:MAG: LuxR C-terminal-related transcriptional regulator [Gemmatimonadaceae bacterium]
MVTICIVGDNRLSREGLAQSLGAQVGMEVRRTLRASDTALLAGVRPAPDVVLVTASFADRQCLAVVESIVRHAPGSRVAVMDVAPMAPDIAELVQAGVGGFVLQDALLGELVATVRAVAAGERVLPAAMTTALFAQLHLPGDQAAHSPHPMTRRERDVVVLIAGGMSNKEIAVQLHIATDTVKSHVRHVMDKLSLRTRLQIAAYAHHHRA